jgi:hypothetical protein
VNRQKPSDSSAMTWPEVGGLAPRRTLLIALATFDQVVGCSGNARSKSQCGASARRPAQIARSMLFRQATSNQPISSNKAVLARQFHAYRSSAPAGPAAAS